MPTSDREGKDWISSRIWSYQPDVILDIGVGEGTYATLLRPLLPNALFIGMEIWEPYVEEFHLNDLYDEIIIADVREHWLPGVDVVILGDVLEHMSKPEAISVWNKARAAATMLVATSIPIIECPQIDYPNPHEQHRHVWDHNQALALPGVSAYWAGTTIGVYTAPGLAHDELLPTR